MGAVSRLERALAAGHRWKNRHQYLGRYSVGKLCVFHDYQLRTSATRVAVVLLSSPLPVLLVILSMEAIELGDPGAGLKHNGVTLCRSIVSHTVMTLAMVVTVKKAINIPDADFSIGLMAGISLLVGVALEIFWLPFMVLWRYPVPFRELLGLVPFGVFVVVCHALFARRVVVSHWAKLHVILPVMGAQLTLFYLFLGLSIAFAYVPLAGQAVMILLFPVVKVLLKKSLWKYTQWLDDISTDVTICMVEISGALYQTVCLQHVQSLALSVLLLVVDFVQALVEVKLYIAHDYTADHRSTLHTAVKIVESALFPSVSDIDKPRGPHSNLIPPHTQNRRRWWCVCRASAKVHSLTRPKHATFLRQSFQAASCSVLITPDSLRAHELLDLSSLAVNTVPPRLQSAPTERTNSVMVATAATTLIDGIPIKRRDQAHVLEQSLQLLFSCEVLLFVEFMEVLLPLVYAVYVGVAWHLPNAKYNYVLMQMTRAQMVQTVASSLIYAFLEAISLALMAWLMERKYGVKPLYQLAFVLETYGPTLQGKLVGAFITIVNSATVHQGIDFTFRFQYGASDGVT